MKNICPFCGAETKGRQRVCSSLECIEKMKTSWNKGNIVIPDGFVTVTEYAKLKGVSVQLVARNCRSLKYDGAFQDTQSGRWYIPIDETSKESARVGRPNVVDRRKKRPLAANNSEWTKIVEKAALTKYSVNDYIIKKALDLPIE